MTQHQKNIREFTAKAGQVIPESPVLTLSTETMILRLNLIAEELCELADAFGCALDIDFLPRNKPYISIAKVKSEPFDLINAYDAVLDLDYVVTGCACALGVDMESGQHEVHRSNMSKFIDGHRRADGKWIKGPSYIPAKLKEILQQQISNKL